MAASGKFEALWKQLDALELYETWVVPASVVPSQSTKAASVYNNLKMRMSRMAGLSVKDKDGTPSILFVRVE